MKGKERVLHKYPTPQKTIFYYNCFNKKQTKRLKLELEVLLLFLEAGEKNLKGFLYPDSYFFIRVPERIEELKKLLNNFPETEIKLQKRKLTMIAFEKK